ncbi:hypothetical protein QR685DRAFT_513162 [Neurospora intermedia]|uniref:Ribosomal protein S11 n=1 Tax=Neurospora intermedia TaxID=5142 RepID=A0ABR3DSF7_NEUIN
MIGSGKVYTPFRARDDPQVSYQYGSEPSQTVAKTILDAGIHNCGRAVLKVRGVANKKKKFVTGHINIIMLKTMRVTTS